MDIIKIGFEMGKMIKREATLKGVRLSNLDRNEVEASPGEGNTECNAETDGECHFSPLFLPRPLRLSLCLCLSLSLSLARECARAHAHSLPLFTYSLTHSPHTTARSSDRAAGRSGAPPPGSLSLPLHLFLSLPPSLSLHSLLRRMTRQRGRKGGCWGEGGGGGAD